MQADLQNAALTQAEEVSAPHPGREIFALTDEQILEMEPALDAQEVAPADTAATSVALQAANAHNVAAQEPPKWLADLMADEQSGGEAKEFWSGIQKAQAEAAEYRAVFASAQEAKAAAERARTLDEFDAAYFGAAGKPEGEVSAARTALAQKLLHENPAAFREMVNAGIKAINEVTKLKNSEVMTNAGPGADSQEAAPQDAKSEQRLAAYAEFEKSTNAELESRIGGEIARTIERALPHAERMERSDAKGGMAGSLRAKLSAAIREDMESALQGDRQLGERVAQVLQSGSLNEQMRAQVVQLIEARARQLLPGSARKVLQEWTQTALAAHRTGASSDQKENVEVAQSSSVTRSQAQPGAAGPQRESPRRDTWSGAQGRIDYRKVSDEQILNL